MGDEKDKIDSGGQFSKSGTSGDDFLTHRPSFPPPPFPVSPITRLDQLEQFIITTTGSRLKDPHAATNEAPSKILSVESLLDCLIVLYDECQNSSLRREKTVSEFLELRKSIALSCSVNEFKQNSVDFQLSKPFRVLSSSGCPRMTSRSSKSLAVEPSASSASCG